MMKFTFSLLLIGLLLWFLGTKFGMGQQQEVEKWTVETHDRTNFPLTGRHRTVSCVECHLNKVLEGTPTACEVCHWERRQDDRHELRLGAQCADCHTTFSWKNVSPNKWNHISVVGYALEGVHRTLDCVECHGESGFVRASIECFSCHEEDFEEAEEPDHAAAGFPIQCQLCHLNTSQWEGAEFTHDGFRLRGQHKTASCQECHFSGVYRGLPSDCVDCHLEDYNETDEPDHRELGFPLDCVLCHRTNANTWENTKFLHSAFSLKGKHRTASCSECHTEGRYEGLPSECVDCHLEDYNETDDPDHRRNNFPTDCVQCHGTNAVTWENAEFRHTAFVLKGEHKIAQCSECHVNGRYEGISSECVACHLDDYNRTDDPDHKRLGFPIDCEQCHGSGANTWDNADFDHYASWPLRSAHKNLDCASCHASGYELPRDCYGCHAQDYQAARNPNHRTAGFPTACENCHFPSHVYWSQAVFNHQFPIESGRHNGLSCTDCHVSSNYRDFSCIDCHAHERSEMDNEHRDVSGYAYNSQSCYGCHPQGRE
jgi:hypothetical protein